MGHPQVRWLVWLMTQDGGMTAQLQGDHEGVVYLCAADKYCRRTHRLL
jgi:hypothetical protein